VGTKQLIECKTHGFYLTRIQARDLFFQKHWQIPVCSFEEKGRIDTCLSQPYHLIGSGSECFVFASQDGLTVIKFFKLDFIRWSYLKKGLFLEDHSSAAGTLSNHFLTKINIPGPFQYLLNRLLGIREFRIDRSFNSVKLAYENLQKETGIFYYHLQPSNHLHHPLKIYDGNGISHEIDLDSTPFLLQKRSVLLKDHFRILRHEKKSDEAKQSIDSLISLILDRAKKGLADRDVATKNLGFIGTQAMEIDVGSFHENSRLKEPWLYHQELYYTTWEVKNWLKKNYPEMAIYLETRVSEEIHVWKSPMQTILPIFPAPTSTIYKNTRPPRAKGRGGFSKFFSDFDGTEKNKYNK
jgi:hypothetical protein